MGKDHARSCFKKGSRLPLYLFRFINDFFQILESLFHDQAQVWLNDHVIKLKLRLLSHTFIPQADPWLVRDPLVC